MGLGWIIWSTLQPWAVYSKKLILLEVILIQSLQLFLFTIFYVGIQFTKSHAYHNINLYHYYISYNKYYNNIVKKNYISGRACLILLFQPWTYKSMFQPNTFLLLTFTDMSRSRCRSHDVTQRITRRVHLFFLDHERYKFIPHNLKDSKHFPKYL